MASGGAGVLAIIDHLRSSESFTLTPMTFLAIIQQALGVSFVETRRLYEFLDADLRPLSDDAAADADRLGDELLVRSRGGSRNG